MERIIPSKLNRGDIIGVIAPSDPIIGEKVEEVMQAKAKVEADGFKVKFGKHLFSNTTGYSATAKEKAEDINSMFADKDVKMIWFAKGGNNSNSVFEYLDYELIKNNPKIICGYSDITSLTNIIAEKTGLVTFSATNFKTIATDETDFSYNEAIKRFVDGSLVFGMGENDKYETISTGLSEVNNDNCKNSPSQEKDKEVVLKSGTVVEGELIGGNLFLTRGLVAGKYSINFENKILFLEELGFESPPQVVSNSLYFLKQNGVFDKIKGLWLGNYESNTGITLEQILLDVCRTRH